MNVLVVGQGGREHALCWKIARSPSVKNLYCLPGREGFADAARPAGVGTEHADAFAREKNIDLVVVGPEAPLAEGMADRLRKTGIRVFGPGKAGAQLEGSKIFAKTFMERNGIATAGFFSCTDPGEAKKAIDRIGDNVVIKADGLAAGKGVIVCSSRKEALDAVERLMVKEEMGSSGRRLVVEERLEGLEVSIIAICDGKNYCMLLPTQDHKRIFDNDEGPNTGGMGAYAPAEKVAPPQVIRTVEKRVVIPALEGMQRENIDFRGTLYCGLMITPEGESKVLEFNVRFGDPETQPQMLLLDDDLAQVLFEAASGELTKTDLAWKPGAAVIVVLASEGYPGKVRKGDEISGLDDAARDDGHVVFHAGTKKEDGKWITDGGRVLGVTAVGRDLEDARKEAYAMVEKIGWRGMQLRRDIGLKGL
jgi:phosphoribosylamine--glycine ligase